MRNSLTIITLALILASCASPPIDNAAKPSARDAKAEIAEFCARNPVRFTSPLDLSSPRDATISKRLQPLCSDLSKVDGLNFGDGLTAYECGAYIPRQTIEQAAEMYKELAKTDDRKDFKELVAIHKKELKKNWDQVKALSNTLGVELSMNSFHSAGAEPTDIAEAEYQRGLKSGKRQINGMPLGYSTTFDGVYFQIIALADDTGTFKQTIVTRDELAGKLQRVETLAGAAHLLSLRQLTDSGYGGDLCRAEKLQETQTGWQISGAMIDRNCRNSVIRDYEVSRTGETSMTKETPTDKQNACYD
ncbi:MAG: hypothetical protein ACOH12_07755 [Parvibaculaceae bacterium]